MKSIFSILITLILASCNNTTKTKDINESKNGLISVDTILVKIENEIDRHYDIGFIKKSFFYYWVTEKDTLDFAIGLKEYVRDGSVNLRIYHRNPILFSDALAKISDCLPLIEQDFNLNNLTSLDFELPIFYKDLSTELSKNYKSQFGVKNIKYQELNEFLKESWLDNRLQIFLKQFDKTTRNYHIEKFHLLNKENYGDYIPNENLNDYPSFTINGMGFSVSLNEKQ